MGGARATDAKIVRRRDEALAKMEVPDAIGHHARRKGIAWIGQPVGEL